MSAISFILNRITVKDRAFLSRQLATMLGSGIPLTESLKVLLMETKNPVIAEDMAEIIRDIESGLSFSAAAEKHPELFNNVYIAVARSGEASGKLEDVLNQMATNIEQENDTNGKIRGAMVYPVFILLAMIAVSLLMLVKVIPQLKTIFNESEAVLPLTTQLLVSFSDFLVTSWWVVLILLITAVIAVRVYLQTPGGVLLINQIQVRFPQVSEDLYMARFTRTMSMLIKAGLPIIESLDIAGNVMNNSVYRDALIQAKIQVERGIPLSTPLGQSSYFPTIVPQMVRVGEQTGRLDEILEKLATYYESELDTRIRTISSLIEPIIIVILGVAVAFLVIAILMPIYNLAQIQ